MILYSKKFKYFQYKIGNLVSNIILNGNYVWYKQKELYATLHTNVIKLKKLN